MKNFSDYLEVIQECSKKGEAAKETATSYFKMINNKAEESTLEKLIEELKETLNNQESFNVIINKDAIESFKDVLRKNNLLEYEEKKISVDTSLGRSYRQMKGLDKYKQAAYVELNFNRGKTDYKMKDKNFFNVTKKLF